MYHKVFIAGNLGRDPELRYTPEGTPVTTFSVATNRKWNNPDGSQGEEVVWFRVTCWRRQAEAANQFLKKGRMVLVEGRLQPDKETGGPRVWTGQDGKPRASYEITAETIKFIGGNSGSGQDAAGESEAGFETLPESEIPF